MASDFNKLVYREVEEHVKAQTAGRKFKKEEWRALMDVVMAQFAKSIVGIVAQVAQGQADAKAKLAAEAEAQKLRTDVVIPDSAKDTATA